MRLNLREVIDWTEKEWKFTLTVETKTIVTPQWREVYEKSVVIATWEDI